MSYLVSKEEADLAAANSPDIELREQDRWLPIANVARLMKNTLPTTAKVSKDAKECMQECVSEFISFITSEASDKCLREKRKTINGEDVLYSMHDLGFENYAEVLKIYLAKYREQQALKQERGETRHPKKLSRSKQLDDQLQVDDDFSKSQADGEDENGPSSLASLEHYSTSPIDKQAHHPDYYDHYASNKDDGADEISGGSSVDGQSLDLKENVNVGVNLDDVHASDMNEKHNTAYQYSDFMHDETNDLEHEHNPKSLEDVDGQHITDDQSHSSHDNIQTTDQTDGNINNFAEGDGEIDGLDISNQNYYD